MPQIVVDRSSDHPGGHIHLVPLTLEVKPPRAFFLRSLCPHGVAHCLEIGEGVVLWRDMVENELHFLVIGEVIDGARLEVLEGVVGRGEEGEALGGGVELALNLGELLGFLEEADEGGVLPGFFEDCG